MSCYKLLQERGFAPVKIRGKQAFYFSPFRYETKPSLTVNLSDDIWYDFGSGEGGNSIQLEKLLASLPIIQAKTAVDDLVPEPIKTSGVEILQITGLIDKRLIAYLKSRRINIELARPFVVQLTIKTEKRIQNVIGFKNDKGGYEMRNAYVKMCNSPKWFTTIEGDGISGSYDIFEGFMDYLSYITMIGSPTARTAIILNSVAMVGKIKTKGRPLFFFGDNDEAGDTTFARLSNCTDMRTSYKGYKDLNDFLIRKS